MVRKTRKIQVVERREVEVGNDPGRAMGADAAEDPNSRVLLLGLCNADLD